MKTGYLLKKAVPIDCGKNECTRARKTVGITIKEELLAEARKRGLNISRITEEALARILNNSSATMTHGIESNAVQPTSVEAVVTRVPENPERSHKTELESEAKVPETNTCATRVQDDAEEASTTLLDQKNDSSSADNPEALVKASPIDRLATALRTVMEPVDIREESGYLALKSKRKLTEDEHSHIVNAICALGSHCEGSVFKWEECGIVPENPHRSKNGFEKVSTVSHRSPSGST